jgi:KaiC domain protein
MSSEDDPEKEDDDWFERALRGGTNRDAESDSAASEDTHEAAGVSDTDGSADEPGAASGEDATGAASGEDATGIESGGTETAGSDSPFEADFATAFRNAPDPGGGGTPEAGNDGGFEESSFESAIPRVDVGIDGLDDMIQEGVPERSLMVSIGSAGTGKTTFGLQFIHHGLQRGENAVFITLEESYERIMQSADDKGWEFSAYEENGQLAVVDLDPIEMANSLRSIRSELPDLVDEFDASRLVLDSVSLLEMMYDDQATRRNEIYDFTGSLKRAGVTTMLTSEASEDSPYNSRFGIIEYLTDAVLVLQYVRPDDFQETRLAVEIQKIRDANHSRDIKPYELTSDGIDVYQQASIF